MNMLWSQNADAIISALLNGIFQGSVLCGLIWIMVRLCKNFNASTRYLVWLSALGCICLLPFIHFLLAGTGVGQDVQKHALERSTPVHTPVTLETPQNTELIPPLSEHDILLLLESLETVATTPPIPSDASPTAPFSNPSFQLGDVNVSEASPQIPNDITTDEEPLTTIKPANTPGTPTAWDWRQIRSTTFKTFWPPFLSMGLLCVMGMIIAFKLLRLGVDLILLKRLKRESLPTSKELELLIVRLNFHSQGNRRVQIRVHETIKTPLALGFFQPMILLPQSLVEDMDERRLSHILRHEWAHVVRYDDWTNFFQRLVEALFFFHPVVALVGRRLDVEREIACDDHVLSEGSQAKEYALMLTQFANRERDRHLATATAGWNKKHQIKERIDMLLDHHRNTAPRPARVGAGLITLAILAAAIIALNVSPRLAVAQSAAGPQGQSNVDELFEEPVDKPRSKTNGRTSSSTASNSGLSAPEESLPGLASSLDPTEPVVPAESAPEPVPLNAPIPASPEASVRIRSTGSGSAVEVVSEPTSTNRRRYGASSIRRRNNSSSDAPGFPAIAGDITPPQVEVQVGRVPDYNTPPTMFQTTQPDPRQGHRNYRESALEKRIKALENLVHRLIRDEAHHHEDGMFFNENHASEVHGVHSHPGVDESMATDELFSHTTRSYTPNTADAAANPYRSVQNVERNAQRAAQFADNHAQQAERYARQTERIVRAHSLRGLESLQEQKAQLEAQRQRLNNQIKALDKRVKSLDRKLAQEMAEIESQQGLFGELNAAEDESTADSAY